jgi:Ser/Thr protein kinase RdoA (MazF antagonist)
MGEEGRSLAQVAGAFAVEGVFAGAEPHGSGHIHETHLARYAGPAGLRRCILQRLDTQIFSDPAALMENLLRVTGHLRAKLEARGVADAERRCLGPIPTRRGNLLHWDAAGGAWRAFRFVEGSCSLQAVRGPEQAAAAARAFGAFAADLADLGAPRLRDTIPHFHDLARRRAALEQVLASDPHRRARATRAELAGLRAALARLEERFPLAQREALPRRVAHHDCKLDNLLFDARTQEALCVIDLDTVMEGTLVSDFGELVRTTACRAAEDERDLARIDFDLALFAALARGYLEGAGPLLGSAERRALPFAGALLALMNALRFLTDHLAGDGYFRIHRPGHNLDRARAQLRLAECMLARADEACEIVEAAASP